MAPLISSSVLLEKGASTRLAWLDMLRGIAALIVALHHATFYFTPELRARMVDWVDPGMYGVLVFFLVSGYIVPASLERHGRVRNFWISRLARIYPLLLVACGAMVLPYLLGVRGLRAGLEQYEPATAVVAHLTMLQDMLDVPNVINVLWTLSYEMLFYLLVVGLFVVRLHRRSAPVAVTLAAVAVVGGGLLPSMALSGRFGDGPVVAVTGLVLVAAIAAAVSGLPYLRTAGGIVGGVLAITLATMNGRVGAWESLVILAVMFTGTAIYRAEHGQIDRRAAMAAIVLVAAGAVFAPERANDFHVYWAGALLLATVTFATAWLLRHRRVPAWLAWLGRISFSTYLLHPVLLMVFRQFGWMPDHDNLFRLGIFVGLLLAISALTYRYIEAPFQRLGRRLAHGTAGARTGALMPAEPVPAPHTTT